MTRARKEAAAKAEALTAFADATRTTEVLFRRDDGSGVTVNDLLRETAARYHADGIDPQPDSEDTP